MRVTSSSGAAHRQQLDTTWGNNYSRDRNYASITYAPSKCKCWVVTKYQRYGSTLLPWTLHLSLGGFCLAKFPTTLAPIFIKTLGSFECSIGRPSELVPRKSTMWICVRVLRIHMVDSHPHSDYTHPLQKFINTLYWLFACQPYGVFPYFWNYRRLIPLESFWRVWNASQS